MTVITDTVHSIGEIGSAISGRAAPLTGDYYRYIYGESDPTEPIPTQELVLVPTEQAKTQEEILLTTNNLDRVDTHNSASQASNSTSSLPLFGLFILVVLGMLVWLAYFIIRTWQDHQARLTVLQAKQNPHGPVPIGSNKTNTQQPAEEKQKTTQVSWRGTLEEQHHKLKDLLTRKGVPGDSIDTQLKNVSAGQFAAADLAWEAHLTTEHLLAQQDEAATPEAITRAHGLYEQVFSRHTT